MATASGDRSRRADVRTDRDILESAKAVAHQAKKVDAVVAEAIDAGLDGSDPITVAVEMVRVELLRVRGELEPAESSSGM